MLLTSQIAGGSDDTEIFAHLPEDQRRRLEEKAHRLKEIDRQKRVPFIIHELKAALSLPGGAGPGSIDTIDPGWLLAGLKGERPSVVAAILVTLSSPVVRALLKRLPPGIRRGLPPKGQMNQVPVEIVKAIRLFFEQRFAPMPAPPRGTIHYRDVIHLDPRDLFILMRRLGLVELGQAFASVGKGALAELCRRLPADKSEELISAVRATGSTDVPDQKTVQHFLSRVLVNFNDTEELFQKAGLWRLAKAAMSEDDAFAQSFRQRLPKEAGELFVTFVQKAREAGEAPPNLGTSILREVKALSAAGQIQSHWQTAQFATD